MNFGILLKETMSGWMELEGEDRRTFSFTIRAFTERVLTITAPRHFRGVANIGGLSESIPISGTLIIYPSGPAYELEFNLPGHGCVRVEGKKNYTLRNLKMSMITCGNMRVHKQGHMIGRAETIYREPLWQFPLRSLRLVSKRNAYGEYA